MGSSLAFPIVKEEVCYLITTEYASTGEPLVCRSGKKNKWVGIVIKEFSKPMVVKRAAIMEAERKFLETDYDKLTVKYPFWTKDDILDIKALFLQFDINHDGLIGFDEMSVGLDELGDKTTKQQRIDNFRKIDADNSGTVDFEEYLEVLAKSLEDGSFSILNKDPTSVGNLNKLTVQQQIDHGLF